MGFRNPVTTLPATAITGQITGSQLAADAIDGKTVTGAVLQTAHTPPNIQLVPETAFAVLDTQGAPFYPPGLVYNSGDPLEQTPGYLVSYAGTQVGGGPVTELAAPDLTTTRDTARIQLTGAGRGATASVTDVVGSSVAWLDDVHWVARPASNVHGPQLSVNYPFNGSTPNGRFVFANINDTTPAYGEISGAWLYHHPDTHLAEAWISIATGLTTGWAAGPASGSVQSPRVRIDAEDNLVLNGAYHTTTTTTGTRITTFSLAAYRPKVTQRWPVVSNASGVATARFMELDTAGNLSVFPAITTSGTDLYIQGTIPLGNIT